jgi:glycosyltransferase involved in cell wall biosynthesis
MMSSISRTQLVSIAMITYNHEPYIKQAIESIIRQKTTFKIELVLGEDCSKDATRSICEQYALQYPSIIKLLPSLANLGVTPNFIRTLKACSGDYIALCEGDDYWTDPLKLQKQVDFLETREDFVASYHAVEVVDTHGNLVRRSKNSFLHNRDLPQEELISGRVMSIVSLCFRNVIRDYPEEFYKSPTGDNFLCSLLGNYGKGKYQVEIDPSAYRMHTGGMWSLQDDTQKKMILLVSFFWLWQYYTRIGKPQYALLFYKKIILESFYSDPFKGYPLGKVELFVVRSVRRFFRLARRFFVRSANESVIENDD